MRRRLRPAWMKQIEELSRFAKLYSMYSAHCICISVIIQQAKKKQAFLHLLFVLLVAVCSVHDS